MGRVLKWTFRASCVALAQLRLRESAKSDMRICRAYGCNAKGGACKARAFIAAIAVSD